MNQDSESLTSNDSAILYVFTQGYMFNTCSIELTLRAVLHNVGLQKAVLQKATVKIKLKDPYLQHPGLFWYINKENP